MHLPYNNITNYFRGRASVKAVAFTSNGRWLIMALSDDSLNAFDLESRGRPFTFRDGDSRYVDNLFAVISNSEQVISGLRYGKLKVWDLGTRTNLKSFGSCFDYYEDILRPTLDQICAIVGGWLVWEILLGSIFIPAFAIIGKLRFGLILFSIVLATEMAWNHFPTRERVLNNIHATNINGTIAVTPNGKRVISGSSWGRLRVWDLEAKRKLFILSGHTKSVYTVAITPNSRWMISGSSDNTLRVWDIVNGTELFTLTGHNDSINAVAVTPDGNRVISGSSDNTLKVWDLSSGSVIDSFTGDGAILCCAVAPDGNWVISGSSDNTLKVWDLSSGSVIDSFTGDSAILCCAVAPDGAMIVAGDASGRVHFLQLEQT